MDSNMRKLASLVGLDPKKGGGGSRVIYRYVLWGIWEVKEDCGICMIHYMNT